MRLLAAWRDLNETETQAMEMMENSSSAVSRSAVL